MTGRANTLRKEKLPVAFLSASFACVKASSVEYLCGMSILHKVLKRAGGSTKLGKALGISRQAVEQWRTVPPERVLAVERLTNISRYELRPDIYGAAPESIKNGSARQVA